MKYVCLIYQEEAKLQAIPEAELDAMMCECEAWVETLKYHGTHIASSALQSVRNAMTLRQREGKMAVTDGPFSETKEFLAGFTIFEARDLTEAIQVAAKLPATKIGSVEVRPLMDPSAQCTDPIDLKVVASFERTSHR